MSEQPQPIRSPFLHTDLPYTQQKQIELARDLIRNAIILSKDAGVSPPLMLNALLGEAAIITSCAPSATARARIVDAVQQNFGVLVEVHRQQAERRDG